MSEITQPWRPKVGSISTDRVAISGNYGVLDLFAGSNGYYFQYINPKDFVLERSVIDNAVHVREVMTSSAESFLYFVVPNKASCLPENYPIWLPTHPTVTFSSIKSELDRFEGNFFGDWMLQGPFSERRELWFETDSHWNSAGARRAATELLSSIKGVLPKVRMTENVNAWGGDLSGRWAGQFASESLQRHFGFDQGRVIVSDNGSGAIHTANTGRFLHWYNCLAEMSISVLIIGDSFSGTGFLPENMTYWFSMVFEHTYFLYSALVPSDILEVIKADIVVFQTKERFLTRQGVHEVTFECLTEQFANKTLGGAR